MNIPPKRRMRLLLPLRVRLPLIFAFLIAPTITLYSSLFLGQDVKSEISAKFQELSIPPPKLDAGLHIVVSHCSHPLDWVFDRYLVGIAFKSVTVITKCGQPTFSNVAIELPDRAMIRIESVPNVGRCDHSYAHWIEQFLASRETKTSVGWRYHPNDQVLFMKDNDNTYRDGAEYAHSLKAMMNRTARHGFACGSRLGTSYGEMSAAAIPTNYAERQTIGKYSLHAYRPKHSHYSPAGDVPFKATIRPMTSWAANLPVNVSFSTPGIVEVCFGGVFMSSIQQIVNAPVTNWTAIVSALARGDNIEEGHYMERLWAGLLAPPVPKEKQQSLLEEQEGIMQGIRNGYLGVLFLKGNSHILDDDG